MMSKAGYKPTPEQNNIICNADGRVKVVAVPGSGKSTVIRDRIIYILDNKKADLNDILILTFTNQAVWQMKDKLYAEIRRRKDNINKDELPVYTFHGLCNSLIGNKKYFDKINYTIVNEYSQLRMIDEINDEYQLYDNPDKDAKREIVKHIGDIKSVTDGEAADYAKYLISSDYDDELDKKIVDEKRFDIQLLYIYIKKQKEHKSIEFEDLINIVLYKFRTDNRFRTELKRKYKYIFCDEFQDVNDKQNQLVNYLSEGYNNLMVVGDDDQNVYSWRGANFRFIKDFEGKRMPLSVNFRCVPEVLDVARCLIEHNQERDKKEIRAGRKPSQSKPMYIKFSRQPDEAAWIADTISKWSDKLNKDSTEGKCAVLVRRRSQLDEIKTALDARHVKYYEDGNENMEMREEYKIFYCYLKMVLNYDKSDDDFVATVNYPNRGFGKKSLEYLLEYKRDDESLIEALTRRLKEPAEVKKEKNRRLRIYCDTIKQLHEGMLDNRYDCMIIIDTLYNLAFGDKKEGNDDISFVITKRLKKRISDRSIPLMEIVQRYDYYLTDDKEARVYLTTAHGSKGLEYDMVFIPGMTEGCFPSRYLHTEAQYEEERRLFYVAITRAKNQLYISSYQENEYMSGIRPSSLLGDIRPELLEQKIF